MTTTTTTGEINQALIISDLNIKPTSFSLMLTPVYFIDSFQTTYVSLLSVHLSVTLFFSPKLHMWVRRTSTGLVPMNYRRWSCFVLVSGVSFFLFFGFIKDIKFNFNEWNLKMFILFLWMSDWRVLFWTSTQFSSETNKQANRQQQQQKKRRRCNEWKIATTHFLEVFLDCSYTLGLLPFDSNYRQALKSGFSNLMYFSLRLQKIYIYKTNIVV